MRKITSFNNLFAMYVVALVFGTTVAHGGGWITINDFVLGVMWGTGFTLIIQFFYRTRPPPDPPSSTTTTTTVGAKDVP